MLVVVGGAMAAQQIVTVVGMLTFRNPAMATLPPSQWVWYAAGLVSPALLIAAGAYFSSGGRYVLNLLFPTNATTCDSCGYSLQSLSTDRCPECGCSIAGRESTERSRAS